MEITPPTVTSTSIQFSYQVASSILNPQIDIYVNGGKRNAEGLVYIDDLHPDTSNFISVVAKYEENGQTIQSIIRTFQVNDTKAADKITLKKHLKGLMLCFRVMIQVGRYPKCIW